MPNTPSQGDTFFDSMHNSKYSEESKIKNKTKKQNNFYLALNCVLSPIQESLLLGTSEFSEFNPNQTKDENISRYLHHPITKEINKIGNELIRIKSKQNYDTIGKHPYISKYNDMNNIFNEMILSLKSLNNNEHDVGRRTLNYNNSNNSNNINKYNTIHRRNFNKEINYFSNNINNDIEIEHQKHKSSINNNIIYNDKTSNNKKVHLINDSVFTKNNNTKRNKSGQINSTTITKTNLNINKRQETEDVVDIKKQIKYDDKLEDLEEPKDIDLKNYIDEDNKNIFLNDYDSNISSLNSNKNINIINKDKNEEIRINKNEMTNSGVSKNDEILIFDSFIANMNNNSVNNNNNNLSLSKLREKRTSTIKKLRKKYERTEFKKYIYNTNPKLNRYINENPKEFELNLDYDSNKIINNNHLYFSTKKNNPNEFMTISHDISNNKNNINKNLLDNFNDCGSQDNNDFFTINNNNQERNNFIANKIKQNKIELKINNSPEAEFLDFISNKSETTIKNFTDSNMNKQINERQDDTFIIKDIDKDNNKKNDKNTIYEMSNSPKSEKISIRKYTSSITQSGVDENNNTFNINNKNCLYDYTSPDKNPDALIRKNFSLMSSFDNENYNSFFDEIKFNYHSCKNVKLNMNIVNNQFPLINDSKQSEKSNNNSKISLNESITKRNKAYLTSNREKLKDSIINQAPETVYDLTFYQNLIENSKKVRKINFKNILKNHKKIKWENRLHTLCWMMQICEEFAFKRDTYHYACNYFDNYLTFTKDKIKNVKTLELIGITCISISGKIEEVQIPKLKEYANSIDETFGIKDIIEMEQKICLTLGWKLINTNINTWLNWYICQWDLYIESVDDIKEKLLKFINEEDIIFYKKTIDNSYYNYRKISQLVDIIILDYYSYNFEPRVLMAVCLLLIICINYNLDYNFKKKNFKQKTEFSKYIFDVYIQFINQSFDFNFHDKTIQKALEYVYKFKNFNFSYELPLLYQIHQDMLEYGNYEDFISYQTTNDNLEDYMKDIYTKRNIKSSSERTTTYTDKNKFFSSHKSSLK